MSLLFNTDDNDCHDNNNNNANNNANNNDNNNAFVCRDSPLTNIVLFTNLPYSYNQLLYDLSLVQPALYSSICDADKSRSSPHCPITCGECCKDDPNYHMGTHNGLEVQFYDCQWLKEGMNEESGKNLRVDYLCDMYNNGIYVLQGCPLTCSICELVEGKGMQEPSSVPTVSAIPTYAKSDKLSSIPMYIPSVSPTNIPSNIPSMSQMPSVISDMPSKRPTLSLQLSEIPSPSPTSLSSTSSQLSNILSPSPMSMPTISSSHTYYQRRTYGEICPISHHPRRTSINL